MKTRVWASAAVLAGVLALVGSGVAEAGGTLRIAMTASETGHFP